MTTARAELVTERGIEGPPDIIAEILSPGTRTLDRRVKQRMYARFRVPEYWIVDPDLGQVELYRLGPEAYELHEQFDRASTLTTPSFAEVAIAMTRVFRP